MDDGVRSAMPAQPRQAVRKVDILNVNFFDWNGEVLYKGGAERYVYDLALLCQSMEMDVRFLQNANNAFERDFKGFPVVGVPVGTGWNFDILSSTFSGFSKDADLLISSPLELSTCLDRRCPAIGINHGIHWDRLGNKYNSQPSVNVGQLVSAVMNNSETVCVDTNFINWFRTVDWQLSRSLRYIPNYYDDTRFVAVEKDFTGKLNVLYPRRLYEPRGLYLTIDAFDKLLPEHPELHLTFCGQADEKDAFLTRRFMERHPDQVTWIERDMDDMAQVYRDSHITIIPTLHSEGTSLSCIEAIGTNNAVIATNVGGLPNIIIDRVNGLLISPEVRDLVTSVKELYQNRELCAELASKALKHSKAFKKSLWNDRWRSVISDVTSL